jgi:DNA-binding CsgD family transcriptional regulator
MYSTSHKLEFKSPFVNDVLRFPEPVTDVDSQSETHAVFVLDSGGNIRRKNFEAADLIAEGNLFRIVDHRLMPLDPDEDLIWLRHLAEIRRSRRCRVALLNGKHSRVAIGLSPRAHGDVAVHIETGINTSEEVLALFCETTGITVSEKEVLRMVLAGVRPKSIASIKSRSEATVRSHIKNVLAKSRCTSVQEVIVLLARIPRFS